MYDVTIVGARCAGSALALLLAREGLKVAVIDQATFPSDTMSGHFIQPAGFSALRRMGLFEHVEALGAPALRRMSLDFGSAIVAGAPATAHDGTDMAFAPRRTVFDAMLIDAAVAAGAEFREATDFDGFIEADGKIGGIRATSLSGRSTEIRAGLVVGADGKRSRVAARAGANAYDTLPASTCCYYAYWDGLPIQGTELRICEGLFSVAAKTNDGLTFLAFARPRDEFTRVRSSIDTAYRQAARTFPVDRRHVLTPIGVQARPRSSSPPLLRYAPQLRP